MASIRVTGGGRLEGEVRISGAKNSAVALMAASCLARDVVVLDNVPNISDVTNMARILESLGCVVTRDQETPGRLIIDARNLQSCTVSYDLAKKLRASCLFLGALLGRRGWAEVGLPGGCNIGSRPIDLHVKGFRSLGASVEIEHGYLKADAPLLAGCQIFLDFPSVGATENLMMAACTAEGQTVIYNAAREPEVVDLANFLGLMGARIRGAGTDTIRIDGTDLDGTGGVVHSIIPDRIEAGTFLLATAATGGEIVLKDVIPVHCEALTGKLVEAGARVEINDESIRLVVADRLKAIQVKTLPYPGFPTDLQPLLAAVLMKADGTSIISERVFENRFAYVDEFKRLGADIRTDGLTGVITGVQSLSGAPVRATDLRMAAALVIAGLMASGETIVEGVEHLDRGYESFCEKLRSIGADVWRVE